LYTCVDGGLMDPEMQRSESEKGIRYVLVEWRIAIGGHIINVSVCSAWSGLRAADRRARAKSDRRNRMMTTAFIFHCERWKLQASQNYRPSLIYHCKISTREKCNKYSFFSRVLLNGYHRRDRGILQYISFCISCPTRWPMICWLIHAIPCK
jgi:hypothetical protein